MAKKHDENKDLKSFSLIGRVNSVDKTLKTSKDATIGIHMWGKIDYLTKYCGWHLIWDNTIVSSNNVEDKPSQSKDKKEVVNKSKKKK